MYQLKNKSIALFSIAYLFSYNVFALNENSLIIERSCLMLPERLGKIAVVHDDDGFHVVQDNQVRTIKKHLVDKKVRNINEEKLRAFLASGYLSVGQFDDGEYKLDAHVRGLGGGPVTAWLLYSLTKSTCYGGAAAALGTATVATGGTIAAALGGGAVVTAATGAAAAGTGYLAAGSALGSAMATGGATVVAGAIGTSAAATSAATIATAGTIAATGGCMATAMATVEVASVSAFTLGMWLPLP